VAARPSAAAVIECMSAASISWSASSVARPTVGVQSGSIFALARVFAGL
jgi:hypothetical protein